MSSSEETHWPLPNTWVWTKAGEITQVIGGGTPDTKNARNFGGAIPWITPADMSTHSGKTIARGSRSLSEKGLSGSGAKWLPEGTVLFSSRAPIGYTAIASIPVTTNQGFKSFVPEAGIGSDYLYHWFASSKERAEKLASGTTFLEISGAKAALISVPLAPLGEQARIVEKLEELLSDLDAGVAELKAAQRKLVQYRQSLLKAAVEGTLTADWRAANSTPKETGAELLQRILTERRAHWEEKQLAKFSEQGKTPPNGWQSKYSDPIAPETKDLPLLPSGWVWASIDQLSKTIRNGLSQKPDQHAAGYPILRINAVRPMRVNLDEVRFLTIDSNDAEGYLIQNGDLLATRYNGSVDLLGVIGVVRGLSRDTLHPDKLIRMQPVLNDHLADWIEIAASTGASRTHIVSRVKTTAGQTGISGDDLKRMPIPLPPLVEQEAAATQILFASRNTSSQETAFEKMLALIVAQRKNILKAAFSGQLVAQDPNDEPASELLARIRAERNANAANASASKRGRKARKGA